MEVVPESGGTKLKRMLPMFGPDSRHQQKTSPWRSQWQQCWVSSSPNNPNNGFYFLFPCILFPLHNPQKCYLQRSTSATDPSHSLTFQCKALSGSSNVVLWPEASEGDDTPSNHFINTYYTLIGTEKRIFKIKMFLRGPLKFKQSIKKQCKRQVDGVIPFLTTLYRKLPQK